MSKKKQHNQSPRSAPKRQENPAPKEKSEAFKFNIRDFIPVTLAFIIFLFLWFKPYEVKLIDPWFDAIPLIDSAKKVNDPILKEKILSQAGQLMGEQVRKHPYHARVHFLYGYYWFQRQNWDSVIFHQKEAIRLGAGGTVNQIEYEAQNMLNSALINKVMGLCTEGKYNQAFETVEKSRTANMVNPDLMKFKGLIYSREGKADSALVYLLKYNKTNPNDADNLSNIGIAYAQRNRRDSALIYIEKALQINPENANAKYVKAQLAGQKQ